MRWQGRPGTASAHSRPVSGRLAGATSRQIATAPVAAGPSAEGFDWPSALIGAATALGVGPVLIAAFGVRSSARITPAR